MMGTTKKIIITNTVALNGGDAAILLALIDSLRDVFGSDTRIVVYGTQTKIVGQHYPELDLREMLYFRATGGSPKGSGSKSAVRRILVRLRIAAWCWGHHLRSLARVLVPAHLREDLEEYSSADLVISTGGTYLVENYRLEPKLFDFDICRLLGTPYAFFTQSLGPFEEAHNRSRLATIFGQALLILVRDEPSRQHVLGLGVDPGKVEACADVAFCLRGAVHEPRPAEPGCLSVAVSVRDWPYFQTVERNVGMANYMAVLADAVSHLVRRHGAHVTFVSTCQGLPEYGNDDSKVATKIVALLAPDVKESVRVVGDFLPPRELVRSLSAYDLLIATRMHMAILGLVAGLPVVPIAYEFKTVELFRNLGQVHLVHDIESIDPEGLRATLEEVCAKLTDICAEMGPRVEELAADARRGTHLIAQRLGDRLS